MKLFTKSSERCIIDLMGLTLDKQWRKQLLHNELQLILLAIITGIFAGTVVTLYNLCARYGEMCSQAWYEAVFTHPWAIPLLFLALGAGAIVIGTVLKFIPLARGSGIPQIEGAIRGAIVFKWFRIMCTSFALSVAAIFLGMSAGSEGPSMLIGGTAGNGVGVILKRDARKTRYLITGGASAGLAAAFNAPLTGFLFAFEEAHKKFTPEIFFTAFFSVVSGLLTRNGLWLLFGLADPELTVTSTFSNFNLTTVTSFADMWKIVGIILLAALITGLLGVGFYYAVIGLRKVFGKIDFLKGTGKFLIPFLLAGAFGLISAYEMGGGHNLIEALGTNGGANQLMHDFSVTLRFASPMLIAIFVVLIMKFIASVINMGCGVPCGVFIPMLAIGACTGGIVSYIAQECGMPPEYSDVIVMICMATFFATIVKAPLTSIVMVFELTGSFNISLLLPTMLGVALGYVIGKIFRTEAIYDMLLEGFIRTDGVAAGGKKEKYVLTVVPGCPADNKEVHDLLLPWSTIITSVKRSEDENIVPSGETVIRAGDVLTIETDTNNRESTQKELEEILGKQESK